MRMPVWGLALALVGASVVMAPAGPTPTTQEVAIKAKIDELYKRLDDLLRNAQGRDWTGLVRTEYADITKEITSLSLGPELSTRGDEYDLKYNDLYKAYQAVWNDKTLDDKAKQTAGAEISKQMGDLSKDYADVLKKRNVVQAQLSARQSRRFNLNQLKKVLKSTDDEWRALEPRLDDVLRLKADLHQLRGQAGVMFGFYYVQIPSPKWENPPAGPEGDLVKTLKAEEVDPAAAKAKLDAARKAKADEEARKNAQVDELTKQLKVAQDKLRDLLTVRQEGALFVEGLLD